MAYRIDTTQPILDYEGKPIVTEEANGDTPEKVLRFRDAIFTICNNWDQDEKPGETEKADAFRVSLSAFAGDDAEYTHEDLAFIKKRSGKIAGALMHGRICEICDQAELAKEPEPEPEPEAPKADTNGSVDGDVDLANAQ